MARDLRRRREEAVRITTAASSRDEEIAARQRRYVFSMAIRTICFVAAIAAAVAGFAALFSRARRRMARVFLALLIAAAALAGTLHLSGQAVSSLTGATYSQS